LKHGNAAAVGADPWRGGCASHVSRSLSAVPSRRRAASTPNWRSAAPSAQPRHHPRPGTPAPCLRRFDPGAAWIPKAKSGRSA